MSGISKGQVSRPCEEIDDTVKGFLDRPIDGDWPYSGSTRPTSRSVAAGASSPLPSSLRWAPTPTAEVKFLGWISARPRLRRSGRISCAS